MEPTGRTDATLPPDRPSLRFALLCDGPCLEAWQANCLSLLLGSGCAELIIVITGADPKPPQADDSLRIGALRSIGARHRHLFWALYHRYFARRASALRDVDCSARIAFADRLECTVIEDERGFACFADRDIVTIRSHDLDFILRFRCGALRGGILTAAKYGVWSYDHDHECKTNAAPIGFWEVMRRQPTTIATLRRLTEAPDFGLVLHKATFATHWHLPTNYDQVAFGSADGCLRVCRAFLADDGPALEGPFSDSGAYTPKIPSNRQVLSFVLNQTTGYLRAKLTKLFYRDEWNVGIVAQSVEALLNQGRLEHVTWLGAAQRGTYLADPIVLDPVASCRFLAERFEYGGGAKGSIVRCDLEADGRLSVVPFLDADHHLSYPFVLHHENGCYLIPESSELGGVLIYPICAHGVAGPPVPLLEGTHAVDATVVRSNHRWWLFCCEGSLKLLAFHAETLDGPWKPHRLNPLKTDVTSSRPAGPLFERDGMLFRPAQDCSSSYGAAVVIHRIVELTPERFREECLGRIGPEAEGPYPKGFHTINIMGEYCLVDGKRTVFDPTWVFRGRTHANKVRARRARLSVMAPPERRTRRP